MRFAIYLTLLFAILPMVLARPFFGLCIYYVVSLLQPKLLCWHPDFQDAMLVGVPLVIGALTIGVWRWEVSPKKDERTGRVIGVLRRVTKSRLFEPAWPLLICVLLIAYIAVTRLFSEFPLESNSYPFRGLCKIVFVTVLLTGMAADFRRLRVLYIVVALAVGFWAIKGGLKVILLGPHQVYGKTYDNNLFALTSAMTLPMLFYFALSVKHAKWRALLMVCAILMCLAIIGSRSRAGFVAFGVVLAGMAWTSRYRLRAMFAVILVVVVTLATTGTEVRERITSILSYRYDRSAASRFWTWQVARDLLVRSPLIGVGFANFEIAKDRYQGGRKAAHNIYLQNLAELGLLGHPLWLLLVFGSLVSMYRFMRWARRLPPEMRWAYQWSRGLCLGMLAFCIHGMFHNEEYLELMFTLVGLNVALQVTTRRELAERRLLDLVEQSRPAKRRRLTRPRLPVEPAHPGRLFGVPA